MLVHEVESNQELKISSKRECRCSSIGERRSFVMITYQSSVAILRVESGREELKKVKKYENYRKRWI